MVSRFNDISRRISKAESMPTPRRRDDEDVHSVLQWLHSLSPDERDKFLDSCMNKTRFLDCQVAQGEVRNG
jgi:hypothetical protein